MANNFDGDAAFQAVYNFESGALETDSKGSNDLTAVNTPLANGIYFKEGLYSCQYVRTSSQAHYRTDANLSTLFPLKYGETNYNMTACGWFYHTANNTGTIFAKYSTQFSFRSWMIQSAFSDSELDFIVGFSGGSSATPIPLFPGTSISLNQWYHLGLTYNRTTNAWQSILYDPVLDSEITNSGTSSQTASISVAPLSIGSYNADTTPADEWDGYIDEAVFANDIKSFSDMRDIRNGVYGAAGGPTIPILTHHYRQQRR